MMRVVWIPSMPGICKSSRTRSGRSSGRSRIASSPDPTEPTRRNVLVTEMTKAAIRIRSGAATDYRHRGLDVLGELLRRRVLVPRRAVRADRQRSFGRALHPLAGYRGVP